MNLTQAPPSHAQGAKNIQVNSPSSLQFQTFLEARVEVR